MYRDIFDAWLRNLTDRHQPFVSDDEGISRYAIAHGSWGIIILGAKVTLSKNEGVAHRPGLRHTHEGVVNGHIAMGVIAFQDFADRTRTFAEGFGGLQAHLIHGVENTPVNGLESVAHIGQGATDNHAHRVVEIGARHFLYDAYGFNIARFHKISS